MDAVEKRLQEIEWRYPTGDPKALKTLEERIAGAGKRARLITYSELVAGITFSLPSLAEPRTIDTRNWQELDRAIVGDFLGYISMRSYERGKFFSSALVVTKDDGTPGEGFHALLRDVGLVPSTKSPKVLDLWIEHVGKAHEWFANH
jgi:hypothetical protein